MELVTFLVGFQGWVFTHACMEMDKEAKTMSEILPDGVGKRHKKRIADENFYFVATRGEDGWIHFSATVPDENKFETIKIRAAVDGTCKELTKMVNALLGNKGRPKGYIGTAKL